MERRDYVGRRWRALQEATAVGGPWLYDRRRASDNQKMNNRIALFKTILERTTDKITFVRKSHGSHHHSEYKNVVNDIDDMIKLDLLLSERYPNLVYDIHIILICDRCFSNI